MAKNLSNTFEWIEHNLNIAKAGDFTIREGNSFNILGGEIPLGQPFAIFIDIGQEAQDVNSGSLFDYSIRPAIFALDNTQPRHITGSGSESFNLNGLYTGTTQKIYRLKIVENSAGTFTQSGNNITGVGTNFHDAMAPLSIFGATNLAGATITSVIDSTHLVVDGPSRTVSGATTFLITPNSVVYQVSTDGGITFTAYDLDDAINCSTSEVALTEGLTIQCHSITAFTEGNEWEFWTPMPQRVEIAVQTTGSGEALTTAVKSVTTQLAEALTDTALTVDVDAGHGIAVNDVIAIDSEKMLVTTVSTNTLTITRGYGKRAGFDGPGSPAVHADNSKVQLVVTADHRQVFVVKIIAGGGSQNTFKYSTDGGETFNNGGGSTDGDGNINIPADPFRHTLRDADNVSYGITIAFSATTGYTANDAFSFHAFPITPFPKWEGNSERVLLGWVKNQGGSKPLKRQFLSGAALQTSETVVDASFTASLMRKGIQSWSTDIRFEGTDFDDLRWYKAQTDAGTAVVGTSTAGSVSFADGTTETITAGANPTGLALGTHYIYKLVGASANATLQITQNYSLVYADEAILLATVVVVTDVGQSSPTIFPFNGNQGTISAGVISAGAILADRIKANEISTTQMASNYKPATLSSVDNNSTATIQGGVTPVHVSANMTGVTMTTAGNIYSGNKNSYDSNEAGWFIGFDSTTPVFNFGSDSNRIRWTGSALEVVGTITGASSITLQDDNSSSNSLTARLTINDSSGNKRLRVRAFNTRDFGLQFIPETAGWMLTHSGSVSGTSTSYGIYPQEQAYSHGTHLGYIFNGYDEALWGTENAPTTDKVFGWSGLLLAGGTPASAARYLHLLHGGTANYKITFPAGLPADNKILKVVSYSGGNATLEWADESGGATLTGSTNNTITTVTSANAIYGEPNLTFDGAKLEINGYTNHNSPVASGSVPTSSYGIFRYESDGGGGSADTLGFLSAQTNATPASANAGSAVWIMLNESDGGTGNKLIFEPSVSYDYNGDVTKNNAWVGWHNILIGVQSYYLQAGNGSASYPSITFINNNDNGFFYNPSQATSTISVSIAGTEEYVFSTNYFKPVTNDQIDLGTVAYKWDDVHATNGTIQTSDRRLKDQIKPTTLGLDFINGLNPVSYKWNSKSTSKSRHITHYGLVAQEVIDTLKDFGLNYEEDFAGITGDEETTYGARYTEFVPILIKAVKELSEKVKKLEEDR